MRKRILIALSGLAAFIASGCQMNQAEASAAYIAAEAGSAAILQKNPTLLPVMQTLVADWTKFQLGTITSTDEVNLLNQIVSATKAKLTPVEAATLDGAVQQLLANQNNTAPTPLQGAAAAIVTDVMNGVARELVIYQAPASAPKLGILAHPAFPSYALNP